MKIRLRFLVKIYYQKTVISCLLTAVVVLIIDYATGRAIRFPIFYLLPVGLAAWSERRFFAYGLAVFLPTMRVAFHFSWNARETVYMAGFNALIAILALIFYAYLVDRVAWQTRMLEKKVRVLEGILPICASCKRIRTEDGVYERMEKYISEHADVAFSHGICPDCARKLYPEYFHEENEVS